MSIVFMIDWVHKPGNMILGRIIYGQNDLRQNDFQVKMRPSSEAKSQKATS